jgi:hypothetical protein
MLASFALACANAPIVNHAHTQNMPMESSESCADPITIRTNAHTFYGSFRNNHFGGISAFVTIHR